MVPGTPEYKPSKLIQSHSVYLGVDVSLIVLVLPFSEWTEDEQIVNKANTLAAFTELFVQWRLEMVKHAVVSSGRNYWCGLRVDETVRKASLGSDCGEHLTLRGRPGSEGSDV